MKRSNAFWNPEPGPSKTTVGLRKVIDDTVKNFIQGLGSLEAAFTFAWAVAQALEKQWRESPEFKALTGTNRDRAQKALADFALASLLHEHEKLHDSAIKYAEKLGMVWP